MKKFWISLLHFIIMVGIWICIISIILICLDKTPSSSSEILSLISVSTGVSGAFLVVYQLTGSRDAARASKRIQEGDFILRYNQSFIQDDNMIRVEHLLEEYWVKYEDEERPPLITDDNRQIFINYLVYLEGVAPLVLGDALSFDAIDDLMAYRFFLAVNDPDMQKDQLFAYPEYYRGCFKLYKEWKRYRKSKGYEIIREDKGLDTWKDFEKYGS